MDWKNNLNVTKDVQENETCCRFVDNNIKLGSLFYGKVASLIKPLFVTWNVLHVSSCQTSVLREF